MTSPVWDPAQYLRHAGPRARPFADLLARVPDLPAERPRIADLGCGPGTLTATLAERWPTAHITGYDSSTEMLAGAESLAGPTPGGGGLDFAEADARTWTPEETHDLIISNATLQWVPGHLDRFSDWIAALAPGATFAFQVPGNFDAPSHRLLRELAAADPRLSGVLRHADAVRTPVEYHAALTALGCAADVWETTYVHLLQGKDAVLEWVKGTALRPVLTALSGDPASRDVFLTDYRVRLREAYPATGHGTPFPFRRIFAVASVPG
ncbi:trans-aconitate 2-methyltransferase [Streptomyces sp. NPDC048290]|uniref:trans-aconitate 2-methyltransferase n=1 Tax=Streptomyces sp. NPDC048290 TaxID=3155811 RepID=UPI0034174D0C